MQSSGNMTEFIFEKYKGGVRIDERKESSRLCGGIIDRFLLYGYRCGLKGRFKLR